MRFDAVGVTVTVFHRASLRRFQRSYSRLQTMRIHARVGRHDSAAAFQDSAPRAPVSLAASRGVRGAASLVRLQVSSRRAVTLRRGDARMELGHVQGRYASQERATDLMRASMTLAMIQITTAHR